MSAERLPGGGGPAHDPDGPRGRGATTIRHFGGPPREGDGFWDRLRDSRLRVHVPFALVLLVGAVGFLRIAMHAWREGSAWLSLALLLAAGMRAVLSREQVGLLAVRSRTVDVLLYLGFGLVLLAVDLTIVGGPLAF